MKTILIILLTIALPSSIFASSSVEELETKINQFVSQLNSKFKLDVTTKQVEECGFSAHQNDENKDKFEIRFCHKDIQFYTELSNSEHPVDSILTIVAHEYSHFLLDYDYSDEASEVAEVSRQTIASEILEANRSNFELLLKLKAVYKSWSDDEEVTILDDEQFKDAIIYVLDLGSHENTDSLSIKLMHMLNYSAVPQVLKHLPIMTNTFDQVMKKMVKARIQVLETSEKESLAGWSNYQCVVQGNEQPGVNATVKKVLSELGYSSLLETFYKTCSKEQIHKNFYRLMDSYYPNA